VSISSSNEPERDSRSKTLPIVQVSAETQSLESSAARTTSASMSSRDSRPRSEPQFKDSLRRELDTIVLTMMKSTGAGKRPKTSSSTPIPSLMPSTKRPVEKSPVTAAQADQPWRISFHRDVAKKIARYGGEDSPAFTPTIRELKHDLATNPKQFPKKLGKLKDARAAHVRFADGVEWVAVFRVFEESRTVRVSSFGPHDEAYAEAENRI